MPLFISATQRIIKQLVNALIGIHSRGVFHRDIKLENILVETGTIAPHIWIIDFGCATLVSDCANTIQGKPLNTALFALQFFFSTSVSLINIVSVWLWFFFSPPSGTVVYTPPEWFLNSNYKPEPTTVWQMGIVMYVMLHSCFPFENTRSIVDHEPEVKTTLSFGEWDAHTRPEHAAERYLFKCFVTLFAVCRHFLLRCLKKSPNDRATLGELKLHPWLI